MNDKIDTIENCEALIDTICRITGRDFRIVRLATKPHYHIMEYRPAKYRDLPDSCVFTPFMGSRELRIYLCGMLGIVDRFSVSLGNISQNFFYPEKRTGKR